MPSTSINDLLTKFDGRREGGGEVMEIHMFPIIVVNVVLNQWYFFRIWSCNLWAPLSVGRLVGRWDCRVIISWKGWKLHFHAPTFSFLLCPPYIVRSVTSLCSLMPACWLCGFSVCLTFLKTGRKLHFHAPIGALILKIHWPSSSSVDDLTILILLSFFSSE